MPAVQLVLAILVRLSHGYREWFGALALADAVSAPVDGLFSVGRTLKGLLYPRDPAVGKLSGPWDIWFFIGLVLLWYQIGRIADRRSLHGARLKSSRLRVPVDLVMIYVSVTLALIAQFVWRKLSFDPLFLASAVLEMIWALVLFVFYGWDVVSCFRGRGGRAGDQGNDREWWPSPRT